MDNNESLLSQYQNDIYQKNRISNETTRALVTAVDDLMKSVDYIQKTELNLLTMVNNLNDRVKELEKK